MYPSAPRHFFAATALIVASLISGCSVLQPTGASSSGSTGSAAPSKPAGPTTPEGKPRNTQVCNAQPAQSMLGKPNTSANLESARKLSGAYMARVLGANQPTTLEFDQERLNLVVDAAGKIIAVRCG